MGRLSGSYVSRSLPAVLIRSSTWCPGYHEDSSGCIPTCEPPCLFGTCSAPYTGSCDKGYSGAQCGEDGCPGGRWGEDCIMNCFCKNGGQCHAVDGRCFCEPNWFGSKCDLYCPFGFMDGDCQPSRENTTCSCPSDVFSCDPELGCVCPPGQDCGVQGGDQEPVSMGFVMADKSSVGVAVLFVFIIVILIMIFSFVLLYYRRKLKKLKKKDLDKRSGQVNHGIEDNELPDKVPALNPFPVLENNQIAAVRPSYDSAQNPLYLVNCNKLEKNINLAKASIELSPSNLDRASMSSTDYELYHEPKELPNNLREILAKGLVTNDNDDYDSYDHLDHKRTINDVSPNYFKFSK